MIGFAKNVFGALLEILIGGPRLVVYLFAFLFGVATIVQCLKQDWPNAVFSLRIFASLSLVIAFLQWRKSNRRRQWRSEMEALSGLERCPISHDQLRELFEFLNRPNSPRCNNRLSESLRFLQDRRLEVEKTLKWFNANGAKCDCEVILNTSQRYGYEVGFEPEANNEIPPEGQP